MAIKRENYSDRIYVSAWGETLWKQMLASPLYYAGLYGDILTVYVNCALFVVN